MFVCLGLDVCMSFSTLALSYFCVNSAFDPVPNFTKQIPLNHYPYHPKFELFTALNYFAGTVRTQKLSGVPFLFELVVVVSE